MRIFIMQMLKIAVLLMICFASTSLVKAQDNPLIYQAFINDSFDPNDGGYVSVLNGLNLKEIRRINSSTINCQRIINPTKHRNLLFINNHPFLNQQRGIFVADLGTGEIIKSFFEGRGVYAIKEAPDGTIWALLDQVNQIAIIDPNTLTVKETLTYNESTRDVIFSPDGERAYISFLNTDVLIIGVKLKNTIANIRNLPKRNDFQVRPQELELSPDGNTLYVGSRNNLSIVDLPSLRILNNIVLRDSGGVGDLLLKASSDGQFLYIGEYLGTDFFVYNVRTQEIKSFITPKQIGTTSRLELSGNNKILYVNRDYGITVFDTEKQTFIGNILTSSGVGFPNPFSGGIFLTGNFSIGQAPSLTTVSPSSGDNILANQSATINWTTTVAPQSYALASHKVELSTDNGQTFTVIPGAEELPGDARSFTWNVPNIESLTAKIKVSTVDLGAKRTSSNTGTFGILRSLPGDIDAPTVNFTSPNGGETFNSGSNLAINWTSSDNVGVTGQDLSLSTDGGQTFPITLASGLAASVQSFSFPIPENLATNQARLRLVVRDAAGNVGQAVTANNFIIAQAADNTAPTVTISQPSSNSNLVAGGPIQVNWTSTDNRAVVSQALLLSLNGGQSFTQVASFGANDSSFLLNNTNGLSLTTPQAIVRITATDQAGNTGQANSTFIISPMLSMSNYQAKLLTVNGIGFMSNSNNNNVQIFINGKLVNVAPKTLTNTNITLKGNKKKLNLSKGGNTVRVVVDGVMSNESSFNF
ncbi:MAG: hypothetical protein WAQ98_09475 [Blastocatellia bacterium]